MGLEHHPEDFSGTDDYIRRRSTTRRWRAWQKHDRPGLPAAALLPRDLDGIPRAHRAPQPGFWLASGPTPAEDAVEIDEALVRHVAQLARIELTPEEVSFMAPQLARIFEHVDLVAQLDLGPDADRLDPATQAPLSLADLRKDEPGEPLDAAAILRNAPAHDGAFLVVPRFLGNDEDADGE